MTKEEIAVLVWGCSQGMDQCAKVPPDAGGRSVGRSRVNRDSHPVSLPTAQVSRLRALLQYPGRATANDPEFLKEGLSINRQMLTHPVPGDAPAQSLRHRPDRPHDMAALQPPRRHLGAGD